MRASAIFDADSQPIKNLVPNPNANSFVGIGASNSQFGASPLLTKVATDGPNGGPYWRVTVNNAFTPAAFADMFQFSNNSWGGSGPTIGSTCPIVPGNIYTITIYVRCSIAQSIRLQAQYIKGNGGASWDSTFSATNANNYTLVPATWTKLTITTKAGLDAQALRLDIDLGGSPLAWSVNDTFEVANAMITEGSSTRPFFDGDSIGGKWIGGSPGTSAYVYSVAHGMTDVRQMQILQGPTYSDAGVSSGTFSQLADPGPTGLPAYRMARNAGTAYGWGVYIAANLPVLTGLSKPLRGSQVVISWWERSNIGGSRYYNIINGGATQMIATSNSVTASGDGITWTKYTTTPMTLSGAYLWRTGADGDPHQFRINAGSLDTSWIDWSDVKLYVLG